MPIYVVSLSRSIFVGGSGVALTAICRVVLMSGRKNNKLENGTGWGHIGEKQEKDFGPVYSVLWFFNKNNRK